MTLVRWEPVRELTSLQHEMNRLFQTFFDSPFTNSTEPNGTANGATAARRWVPPMDLVETEDHFVLRADLPGLGEDDVKLEVEDRVLTIAGERTLAHEVRKGGFHRVERGAGAFSRSLTLPDGIDPDAIAASFDRGVLEVRIPKPEERKPRRLSIAVGDRPKAIEGSESTS